ncbi:MAG TPA: biotin carboxylase N-terminal domain-containing protein [Egibacteraceae bacterium]|nr:biotin carboxylase N-terminal domain-containing protein [Egibacteraceae bacterium]
MIETLLIANRGEIACRIVRSARAMGIRTVAVYSDADAVAPHVEESDEAIALVGDAAADTYLRIDKLLDAAARAGADAVHPGYGFLSENARFASACDDAGLVFVGPTPDVIEAMGDKIAAKATMRAAGVPVLDDAEVADDPDRAGAAVGYPLLVKAAAGGGGKGMRLVTDPADLADAVAAARREAAAAFGDARVFLERYLSPARHVEVQILGDAHGTVVHLGERECSVQRRHQKIIEESPSPALDDDLRGRMTSAAVTAAQALGYRNAGTVEFVLGPGGEFAFLEVNTRLQVEHPVTELAWALRDGTPLDLVALQLAVADHQRLPFRQDDVVCVGHAVQARVYAEDVPAGFLPATGRLRTWRIPQRDGIRVDAGVIEGTEVTVHYDPLLAKVIAAAPRRDLAVQRLLGALRDSAIHGVTTNREFLTRALAHPAFRAGDYDTGLVAQHLSPEQAAPADPLRVAVAAAAAALAEARGNHLAAPLPSVPAGWRNSRSQPHRRAYRHGADTVDVAYTPAGARRWSVEAAGGAATVVVHAWPDERGDDTIDLSWDGRRLRLTVRRSGDDVDVDSVLGHVALVRHSPFADPQAEDAVGAMLAPMPGSVVSVHVEAGQSVERGALLVVLEAMKMEHRVTATADGVVAEVRVRAGDPVATDDALVVLDDSGADYS